jgi:hypothetical protein
MINFSVISKKIQSVYQILDFLKIFQNSKLEIIDFANKFNSSYVNMTANIRSKNDEVITNLYFKMLVDIPIIVVSSNLYFIARLSITIDINLRFALTQNLKVTANQMQGL